MKKMIYLVAAFAAVATLYSCSNDDDVLAQDPIVQEEPSVVAETPLKITVGNNSRATIVSQTAANFEHLWLASMLSDNHATKWLEGVPYTKGDEAWAIDNSYTETVRGWDSNTYDFYAISENEAGGITDNVNTDNMFGDSPSFVYTIPNDIEDQKDLLVAYTQQSKGTGDNEGVVNLNFKHALATIDIMAKLTYRDVDPTKSYTDIKNENIVNFSAGGNGGVSEGDQVTINGMRIHGLRNQATFTFNNSSSTVGAFSNPSLTTGDNDIEVTYLPALTVLAGKIECREDSTNYAYTALTGENYGGSLMAIPQNTTTMAWTPEDWIPDDDGDPDYVDETKCFIELDVENSVNGIEFWYFPLSINIQPGKRYKVILWLDWARGVYDWEGDDGGEADGKMDYFYTGTGVTPGARRMNVSVVEEE